MKLLTILCPVRLMVRFMRWRWWWRKTGCFGIRGSLNLQFWLQSVVCSWLFVVVADIGES
ncbi:hypothetical protein Gotri_005638 [Gossypium trilobum]|uniref:Uncharacterized protein n=1 Tax=Gossypium trilobum TaxID=34281 RepID=A0A7J9EX59_9ROSI|nr:hypothetical protein [Gossypium trilobum]